MNYITFWKKFLLKCFIISFAFLTFAFIIWVNFKSYTFAFANQTIGIDKETYSRLMFEFFANSKYIMFFVFLFPSLALHWMSKCQKQDWKKNIKLDD